MNHFKHFQSAALYLRRYIEAEDYQGYDPYDALNGWFPFRLFGKWGPVIAIQVMKRLPINLRPLLGIQKQTNAKALGLLLEAYALWHQMAPEPALEATCHQLFQRLMKCQSKGYSGICWGYPFHWASPLKYLPAHTPNIVATAFAARGIETYYQSFQKPEALEALCAIVPFVLNDLEREETESGCFISYTPVEKDCCYNASLLAGEILARAGALKKQSEWLEIARQTVEFVVAQQQPDGCWNYSKNLETGKERVQIDFHQGYVIDSIRLIADRGGWKNPAWEKAVEKGASFYRKEQFFEDGRSLWRIPTVWPLEIHNQSQGILTFVHLDQLDSSYSAFANTIGKWTIAHMRHPRKGYFFYRKLSWYTNKIPFMRWSQAWMLLSLVHLMVHAKNSES
ncbi:MAG: hypothetical protein ACFB10_00880 [Salibacteraceae bacterium]